MRRLVPLVLFSILACVRSKPVGTEAGAADGGTPDLFSVIAKAEDARRAKDVPEAARTSHDVTLRRRAARALARIADPQTDDALLRALSDEDEETAAWGAYGLEWTCKGREEAHVRALAARAASLGDDKAKPKAPAGAEAGADAGDATERDGIDPRMTIARSIGRCGGALAEPVLVGWVKANDAWSGRASYGLGDVAGRRGALMDDTYAALLDRAEGGPDYPPADDALYPFGRLEQVNDAFSKRVIAAAHAALGRAGPPSKGSLPVFAVRALARSGNGAAPDLARVAENKDLEPGLRAEAARVLGGLSDAGRSLSAEALNRLTPDQDPLAIAKLTGDEFAVLRALVLSLGGQAPKSAEASLNVLANLSLPGLVQPTLLRRIDDLRCAAASALARGAYDADVLKKCDPDPTSESSERARLTSLLRRPLTTDRRAAWKALAASKHPRVREAALDAIAEHPELAEAAKGALVDALGAKEPGVVATAAEVIHGHPDRVLVLAESERKNALDPSAPPPTTVPAREIEAAVATALRAAAQRNWAEDLVETRVGLLGALVAVHHPSAREFATAACKDPNATVRDHAVKALRSLGDANPACAPPDAAAADAGAAGGPPTLERATRVTFVTDAGDLGIVFEPGLAPVAAARFVELARAGFYNGLVVHRVVPGFVVQFGDPEGDGYGGSGRSLRCETSPVPFGPLDVGVALAGRDTGSSQLFVTLGRFPHLDGEYARVGRAEGDPWALAEGDIIREARVE